MHPCINPFYYLNCSDFYDPYQNPKTLEYFFYNAIKTFDDKKIEDLYQVVPEEQKERVFKCFYNALIRYNLEISRPELKKYSHFFFQKFVFPPTEKRLTPKNLLSSINHEKIHFFLLSGGNLSTLCNVFKKMDFSSNLDREITNLFFAIKTHLQLTNTITRISQLFFTKVLCIPTELSTSIKIILYYIENQISQDNNLSADRLTDFFYLIKGLKDLGFKDLLSSKTLKKLIHLIYKANNTERYFDFLSLFEFDFFIDMVFKYPLEILWGDEIYSLACQLIQEKDWLYLDQKCSNKNPSKNQPLHLIALAGAYDYLKKTPKYMWHYMINQKNAFGETPIVTAAIHSHDDLVIFLLENGAFWNFISSQGLVIQLFSKKVLSYLFPEFGYFKKQPKNRCSYQQLVAELTHNINLLITPERYGYDKNEENANPLLFLCYLQNKKLAKQLKNAIDNKTFKKFIDQIPNHLQQKALNYFKYDIEFDISKKFLSADQYTLAKDSISIEEIFDLFDQINFEDSLIQKLVKELDEEFSDCKDKKERLKNNLKNLIKYIHNNEKYVGTPTDDILRKNFYKQLKSKLQNIIFYLKQDKFKNKRDEHLINIAIASTKCGSRWDAECDMILFLISEKPNNSLQKDIEYYLYEKAKSLCFEITMHKNLADQTHYYRSLLYNIGLSNSFEQLAPKELTKKHTDALFFSHYTPTFIINSLKNIPHQNLKEKLINYFKTKMPENWVPKADPDNPILPLKEEEIPDLTLEEKRQYFLSQEIYEKETIKDQYIIDLLCEYNILIPL